jgi:hypothetical protein
VFSLFVINLCDLHFLLQGFVSEHLAKSVNDQVVWMDWVRKKHKRKNKVQDRLLVVTRYRIFSVKRGITGSKSVRTDQLPF